jgi:hypothetical protein
MKEITLTVTVDEANLILEGIGLLPFARVFQLVGKLQEQARRQLDGDAAGAGARPPASAVGP